MKIAILIVSLILTALQGKCGHHQPEHNPPCEGEGEGEGEDAPVGHPCFADGQPDFLCYDPQVCCGNACCAP